MSQSLPADMHTSSQPTWLFDAPLAPIGPPFKERPSVALFFSLPPDMTSSG